MHVGKIIVIDQTVKFTQVNLEQHFPPILNFHLETRCVSETLCPPIYLTFDLEG
jgi:hypothetical protein